MIHKNTIFRVFVHSIIAAFFLTAACVNDELCVSSETNMIKIAFFDTASVPEAPLSITFDSIGISGLPSNYPVLSDTVLSRMNLGVNPDTSWTRFVFITESRTDTLEVVYKTLPSLISIECGPELLFSELDTLYHTFDSLSIPQNIFDSEVETNIKIYY